MPGEAGPKGDVGAPGNIVSIKIYITSQCKENKRLLHIVDFRFWGCAVSVISRPKYNYCLLLQWVHGAY